MIDPVALTQRLIRFDTVNPPGRERDCALHLAGLLQAAGFETRLVDMPGDRASVIARLGSGGDKPLVFTGHIDVVPLGTRAWSRDPFAGEVDAGRIHGRGASDMKSGVAAFVAAAIEAAVLAGITADGSMPARGDNAVYKAARAVNRLSCFHFGVPAHPVLGAPTLNVGTFHGGLNINSVPDRAEVEIDMRTTPGLDHAALRERIRAHMEEDATLETLVDLPGIWTAPEDPWAASVAEIAARVTGEPRAVKTATYFSDASIFVPAMGGPPTLVLGPGEPALAHQTDEWCDVERVRQAKTIFSEVIAAWK